MTTTELDRRLAILGGDPAFATPLPVGQLYFPSWERYEKAMAAIFDRQWYTNSGPLEAELETRLAQFFGVKHAITVTSATLGLTIAARALELTGKVIVPSFTFIATAQALSWAGLDPVFCDVDPTTQQVTPATVAAAMEEDVSALLAVNLWGGSCGPSELEHFAAEHGLTLFFDSAHGAGSRVDDVPLGRFGALEVFSFHATKVINATEGGCICTDDDELAQRVRGIRSSYGSGARSAMPVTTNGRFSEAQAAIALMSLESFPTARAHNRRIFETYRARIAAIPGLRLVDPSGVSSSNHQCAVLEVDEAAFGLSRDVLVAALHAENVLVRRYFRPGSHRSLPYRDDAARHRSLPVTDALCSSLVHLPIGALVSVRSANRIADLLATVQQAAPLIASRSSAS